MPELPEGYFSGVRNKSFLLVGKHHASCVSALRSRFAGNGILNSRSSRGSSGRNMIVWVSSTAPERFISFNSGTPTPRQA